MADTTTYLNDVQAAAGPLPAVGARQDGGSAAARRAALDRAEALRELRALDDRRLDDIGVQRREVAAMLARVSFATRVRLAVAALVDWLGTADRVILTTAALFLALAVLVPERFVDSLGFTLGSLWSVAPVLLLAALLAAGLSASDASTSGASTNGTEDGGIGPTDWAFWHDPARRGVFRRQSLAIGGVLLKWLTLVFLIESLAIAAIPPS